MDIIFILFEEVYTFLVDIKQKSLTFFFCCFWTYSLFPKGFMLVS